MTPKISAKAKIQQTPVLLMPNAIQVFDVLTTQQLRQTLVKTKQQKDKAVYQTGIAKMDILALLMAVQLLRTPVIQYFQLRLEQLYQLTLVDLITPLSYVKTFTVVLMGILLNVWTK